MTSGGISDFFAMIFLGDGKESLKNIRLRKIDTILILITTVELIQPSITYI
jgi:hypothetical protein